MAKTKCGFDSVPGGAGGNELLEMYGPTLKVDVGFDPAYVPTQVGMIPVSGIRDIDALVDTGAAECCIDSMLAAQLNLPVIDKRVVSGVHGSQEVNMHLAQIHVPALGFTVYGVFAGVHLTAGGQVHRVLMGRTFLRHFTMSYEGHTGTVEIASA